MRLFVFEMVYRKMEAEKGNFLKRGEKIGTRLENVGKKFLSIAIVLAMILLVLVVTLPQGRAAGPGSFSIDTPSNNANVCGSVNISWGQATGAINYTVLIDNAKPGAGISPQNNVTQNWTIWNSSSATDGVHYINVTANNATGSTYAVNNNISVNVDNTAPTVAIAYNISRTYYKDADSVRVFANFTETGSGIDENSVKITIVNSSGTTLNNSLTMTKTSNTNWYFDWHVPASNDGNVNVSIEATDNMSFSLSGTNWSLDKYIDNILPTSEVTIISTYWQNSTPLTINATASDALSGIASVTLYWYNSTDNSTWSGPWSNGTDSTAPYSWRFNFSNGSSSHYRFYSVATDNATNTETNPVNNDTMCFYNNTPPNALGNPSPSNGTTYSTGSRPSSLSWTGGDIDNDAVNYTIYLKAGSSSFTSSDIARYTENTTSYSVSLSWSTTYYWKIVATDEHGVNTSGSVWYFTTGAQSSGSGGTTPPSEEEEDEGAEEGTEPTIEYIEEQYNVTLEEKFYANDTDGDGILDSFTDPNGILTLIHTINISGNPCFLISVDEDGIPEFFWDPAEDNITAIYHNVGIITDSEINAADKIVVITVRVEKANWTYIEITDLYPKASKPIILASDGRSISSDLIWREDNVVKILDDPTVEYFLVYVYEPQDILLNVSLDFSANSISLGDDVNALIKIRNMGELKIINGRVAYTLSKNGATIWYEGDGLLLIEEFTINRTIMTKELSYGEYIFEVTYNYGDGQVSRANAVFIIEPETPSEGVPFVLIIIGLIVSVSILVLVFLFKTKFLGIIREDERKK